MGCRGVCHHAGSCAFLLCPRRMATTGLSSMDGEVEITCLPDVSGKGKGAVERMRQARPSPVATRMLGYPVEGW